MKDEEGNPNYQAVILVFCIFHWPHLLGFALFASRKITLQNKRQKIEGRIAGNRYKREKKKNK